MQKKKKQKFFGCKQIASISFVVHELSLCVTSNVMFHFIIGANPLIIGSKKKEESLSRPLYSISNLFELKRDRKLIFIKMSQLQISN